MAVARRNDNTMLYTVAVFVGLFLIATTVAVLFYVKAEDYRSEAETAVEQRNELATSQQWSNRGDIVGTVASGNSYLGQMNEYLDAAVYSALGGVAEDISAEAKIGKMQSRMDSALESLVPEYITGSRADSNTVGLIPVIQDLKVQLDTTISLAQTRKAELDKLQKRFDEIMQATREKEQELLGEKDRLETIVNNVREDYNELENLLEQTTEQQVQNLRSRTEELEERNKELNQQLMKTEAELKLARERMDSALSKLRKMVPPPDTYVQAFEPDGKIILIGQQEKVVQINLGSADKVYQGLTFSVYDKNLPIPESGKGKAEIEVFSVGENTSSARVVNVRPGQTIIESDIIANLIWDSKQTNYFVVSGDFDLNGDGQADDNGSEKIRALIERWTGQTQQSVTPQTDFIVLGQRPEVPFRPTFEQMEIDPLAMEKYNDAQDRLERFKGLQDEAKNLSIPIFNTERFLYFVGYKSLASEPGAF